MVVTTTLGSCLPEPDLTRVAGAVGWTILAVAAPYFLPEIAFLDRRPEFRHERRAPGEAQKTKFFRHEPSGGPVRTANICGAL
jgi:hypothetical protein